MNTEDLIVITYQLKTYTTLPSDKSDKKSKFTIFVDGELIGLVNSPAYDGARLLVKMGYDPQRLMTTRSMDSQHNSWEPQPIHKFAKLRSVETDNRSVCSKTFREWTRVAPTAALETFRLPTYQKDDEGLKTALFGEVLNE